MNKFLKLFIALSISTLIFLSGCQKDDDVKPVVLDNPNWNATTSVSETEEATTQMAIEGTTQDASEESTESNEPLQIKTIKPHYEFSTEPETEEQTEEPTDPPIEPTDEPSDVVITFQTEEPKTNPPRTNPTEAPKPKATSPQQQAHQHNFSTVKSKKDPTCGEAGYIIKGCSCGKTIKETLAATNKHKFNNGSITKAATCKEAGVKTYKCTVCGKTKTESIPKLTSHKWDKGTITTKPTCGKEGIKTYKCSVCGGIKQEKIAKLTTHTWDNGKITKKATPLEKGEKTYTCKVCHAIKKEAIPHGNVKVGDTVKFGEYNKADVEWIVLAKSDNKALLLSKQIINCEAFNEATLSNNWSSSSIRSWLNKEFLNSVFSNSEKGLIISSKISTQNNAKYGTKGCGTTTDKIFLLSFNEVEQYAKSYLKTTATQFAISSQKGNSASNYNSWYLRSPGKSNKEAMCVGADGKIKEDGKQVNIPYIGIRPAMWVSTN